MCTGLRVLGVFTFPVELQGSQQADGFEHFSDVHLQTALQLDEEPTDLRVDLPVLGPETAQSGNTARSPDLDEPRIQRPTLWMQN